MKIFIKSLISAILLTAIVSTNSFAAGKYVKPQEFGQKLGRAKKDHHLEANLFGGFANKFIGYSIAYGYIVSDGLGEVNIPITYMPKSEQPNTTNKGVIWGSEPFEQTLMSIAIKYRKFRDQIDEGLFYGGGLRVWHITDSYQRLINGTPKDYEDNFQVWNPLAEVGFTHKLSTDMGINTSLEFGGSFSTFPNPPNDPGRESVWSITGVYYSLNLGVFYAF